MTDPFKNYLAGLVESKEDVVEVKVENTFVGEVVEEERGKSIAEVSESKTKDTNKEINDLIQRMLPQFKQEEEVLDRVNKKEDSIELGTVYPSRIVQSNPLHKESYIPKSNSILDTLKKQPTDKLPETTGLPGVEYEVYDPPKIKFMPSLPRHELKSKDHSSLIVAKKCLREYFYANVVNLVPAEETNIFYPWGTAYHIFRQRLSELYGYGKNEPTPYDQTKAKEAFKLASKEATAYWMENGEDQKAGSKFDWFTTARLYQSFVKSFEHWVAERKKGQIKVLAVEQYFSIELPDGEYTSGRIDEAILYNGELWGRDYKTTMKPEEWFAKGMSPNNQVKTYTYGNAKLAGRSARGIIIQAMYNAKSTKKEDKGPLVYEKIIECSDYELNQWEKEQVHWNKILKLCREEDIWPQSEVNCQYCNYQYVCLKSTEASMVHALENKYKIKLRDPARVDVS